MHQNNSGVFLNWQKNDSLKKNYAAFDVKFAALHFMDIHACQMHRQINISFKNQNIVWKLQGFGYFHDNCKYHVICVKMAKLALFALKWRSSRYRKREIFRSLVINSSAISLWELRENYSSALCGCWLRSLTLNHTLRPKKDYLRCGYVFWKCGYISWKRGHISRIYMWICIPGNMDIIHPGNIHGTSY